MTPRRSKTHKLIQTVVVCSDPTPVYLITVKPQYKAFPLMEAQLIASVSKKICRG
jgi:hypothetical protein